MSKKVRTKRQPRARLKPQKPLDEAANQMWRLLDGAALDMLQHHQDYFTPKGLASFRRSLLKRQTGTVMGFVAQKATRGRSGVKPGG